MNNNFSNSTIVAVPVNAVQVNLQTDAGLTVYVPLATRTSPGIVKIGDGLLIDPTTGLLSLDTDEITLLGVKVNGTALVPDEDKYVDVIVPTKTSDLTNDGYDGTSPYATEEYVWNYGGAVNGLILNDVQQTLDENKMIIVNIDKTTIGLGNVDNTSDADKPISTAVNNALSVMQNDIDSKLSKNSADVALMDNLTTSVLNDNVTLTKSFINLKTQVTSTDSFSLPLATDQTGGLMSSADYSQIRNNTSRIEQLEGQTKRLLYTDKTNPTAQEINDFVIDLGYTSPFSGIAVVVDQTFHIWHYYTNTSSWKDDGPDTVSQFTNSSPGVILGSATNGKVYAETDGTGSVYGWDTLTNRVSDLENNMPTNTSDLINDGDGDSPFATQAYVLLNGGKIDSISVNNVAQTIDVNKNVNITVPTNADYVDLTSAQIIEGKKIIKDTSLDFQNSNASGNASWQLEPDQYGQLGLHRTYNNIKSKMVEFNGNSIKPVGSNGNLGSATQRWANVYADNLNDGTNSIAIGNIANKNDILLKPLTLTSTTLSDDQYNLILNYDCILTADFNSLSYAKKGTIFTRPFEYNNTLRGIYITENKIGTYLVNMTTKEIGNGAQDIVLNNVASISTDTYKNGAGSTYMQFRSNDINVTKDLIANSGTNNLGTSTYKWKDLYLSGNLSDGTNSLSIADIASTSYVYANYVSIEPQTLTEAQKAQARQNIGAGSANATSVLVNNVVQSTLSFDSDPQTQITTNTNNISDILALIPAQASASDQLAPKSFVNSTVQTATANFRGNWATWSAVPTDVNNYPVDYAGSKTPTVNDYLVVQDASDYTGQTLEGTWRFKYTGTWSTNGKSGWQPEYQVNETPLTAAQLAALNSGITSTAVAQIGTNTTNIANKMDKVNPTGTGSLSINRKANTIVGYNSIALGNNVSSTGNTSFAEGYDTTASGTFSHAEGGSSTSSGTASHSENWMTTASGDYSHAEGFYTTAQTKSQHVFGEYNVLDTAGSTSTRGSYVEIVGNGTSGSARSNARTLDWSGNEWLAGNLSVTGTITGSQILTSEGGFTAGGAEWTAQAISDGTTNGVLIGDIAFGSSDGGNVVAIGDSAGAEDNGSVSIGSEAYSDIGAVAIGYQTDAHIGGVAIGQYALTGNVAGSIAIGAYAEATASGSIQLGTGTNNTASTFQVGSYQLLDANGKVPNGRLNGTQATYSLSGTTLTITTL